MSSSASQSLGLIRESTLVVASDLANPPLDYVDAQGNPQGFEVDLMQAVAAKMNLTLEYLPPMKFDTIIPAIKQGSKADVGVSNITITDERSKEVAFSEPYLTSNLGVMTLSSMTLPHLESLNDPAYTIAVQAGSTGALWAEENLPQAHIVSLDDPVVGATGVQSGLYHALLTDLPVISYMCHESFSDCKVLFEIATGEEFGIICSKDNKELQKRINEALAELEKDGTLAALRKRWFGSSLS